MAGPIDTSTTPARLSLPPVSLMLRESVDVLKADLPQTAVPLSQTPINSPAVIWNGLEMSVGEDYTYGVGSKLVTLLRPASEGDIVKVRYRW